MPSGADGSIVYATCTEGGYEVLRNLLRKDARVSEIVSLTPEQGDRYGVSGYQSAKPLAERHNVPLYYVEQYDLETDRDRGHFQETDGDLLIVNGWQRLVPEDILRMFDRGALGVHGSADGLPKGRGRSPMNWSILEGMDRFLLSVIQLEEGTDEGAIVDTRKYEVTEFDTIRTLYYKLAMATTEILLESLEPILDGTFEYEPQEGTPTYYPKRKPDDGAIHWRNPTGKIHDLVRAVAEPYPGAFTEVDGARVHVWDAVPFSTDFGRDGRAGEILQVFETTEEFVVRTGDGTLLVREWEADEWEPHEGTVLESLGEPDRADEVIASE